MNSIDSRPGYRMGTQRMQSTESSVLDLQDHRGLCCQVYMVRGRLSPDVYTNSFPLRTDQSRDILHG